MPTQQTADIAIVDALFKDSIKEPLTLKNLVDRLSIETLPSSVPGKIKPFDTLFAERFETCLDKFQNATLQDWQDFFKELTSLRSYMLLPLMCGKKPLEYLADLPSFMQILSQEQRGSLSSAVACNFNKFEDFSLANCAPYFTKCSASQLVGLAHTLARDYPLKNLDGFAILMNAMGPQNNGIIYSAFEKQLKQLACSSLTKWSNVFTSLSGVHFMFLIRERIKNEPLLDLNNVTLLMKTLPQNKKFDLADNVISNLQQYKNAPKEKWHAFLEACPDYQKNKIQVLLPPAILKAIESDSSDKNLSASQGSQSSQGLSNSTQSSPRFFLPAPAKNEEPDPQNQQPKKIDFNDI